MKIGQIKRLAQFVAHNTNKVISNGFNKAGNRLAAKINLPVTSKMQWLECPDGTISIDLVKVERNFGKSSSNIISFKDKDSKVIQRIRTDKTPEMTVETRSNYFSDTHYSDKSNTRLGFTDIIRSKKVNGELQSQSRDMITVSTSPDEVTPVITHSKLLTREHYFGARSETQTIKSWIKGHKAEAKYLETTGLRRNDGRVQLTGIKGNTDTPVDFFAKDPYIMTRMYPKKDFIKSVRHYLADMNEVSVNSLNFKLKKLKNWAGYYQPATNTVCIDMANTKQHLVNTVGHELRHKRQDNMTKTAIVNFFRGIWDGNRGNTNENLLGFHFLKGNGLSILSLNGRIKKFYYASNLEKDAYKAGNRFEMQYRRFTDALHREFPFAKPQHFGGETLDINPAHLSSYIQKAMDEGRVVQAKVPLFINKL